ncbi:RNA repair domain-containing protein [Streptomyces sp. NPDC005805]|uniref:RNA repair domain-containing protein n=1 Tax=Streptomyces sp. NPDC005805 TaxID=3157068 RepID=UPI0033FDDEDF
MRTSEEIYHRVRWDARFDPGRFVIGVHQRAAAPKRVPFPSFVPGGDIPWHRVLFFEADGEVLWDRGTGTDRIDETEAGRVREARRLRAPHFAARVPYAWDGTAWAPAPDARGGSAAGDRVRVGPAAGDRVRVGSAAGDRVRVLTWNTLWDRYDADRIDTARRRPLLLAALRAAEADVIALQEAEPELLAMLLREPWVRDGWTVSDGPRGRDVEECGLLLLSRLPVREAGHLVLGPHKAVTAFVVETAAAGPGGPVPLVVAATHLSSDHSDDGAGRRVRELGLVAQALAAMEGDVVLAGDVNDGTDTPQTALAMRDAWTEAHGPSDATPTFDPRVNPLAAVSSLTGRAGRLDRVLLRSAALAVRSARLAGDSPSPDGLYISDHYGVVADLARPGPEDPDESEEGNEVPLPGPAPDGETRRAERVAARVAEVLRDGAVHLVGSRRLGCALPGADLDLVAAVPGAPGPAVLLRRIADGLPDARTVREVVGARVPGLRFTVEGLRVDLAVVATGAVDPGEAVARRAEPGEAAAVALSAVTDADALLASVSGRVGEFARLAAGVKAWARARGLDSAPFGGLPGLAWCVLAARTVRETGAGAGAGEGPEPLAGFATGAGDGTRAEAGAGPGTRAATGAGTRAATGSGTGTSAGTGGLTTEELLRRFFATWAAWDWREPVSLGGAPAPTGLPVTVLTPSAPVRPCSDQVTAGMRDLLTVELFRGWELLEAGRPAGALLTPPPLHRRHAAWAVLTAGPGADEGRVRGRMRAVLTDLAEAAPAAHAWPRPFASGPETRWAIGLGHSPPGPEVVARVGRERLRGLPGVTLAYADGGGVPVLR